MPRTRETRRATRAPRTPLGRNLLRTSPRYPSPTAATEKLLPPLRPLPSTQTHAHALTNNTQSQTQRTRTSSAAHSARRASIRFCATASHTNTTSTPRHAMAPASPAVHRSAPESHSVSTAAVPSSLGAPFPCQTNFLQPAAATPMKLSGHAGSWRTCLNKSSCAARSVWNRSTTAAAQDRHMQRGTAAPSRTHRFPQTPSHQPTRFSGTRSTCAASRAAPASPRTPSSAPPAPRSAPRSLAAGAGAGGRVRHISRARQGRPRRASRLLQLHLRLLRADALLRARALCVVLLRTHA